MNIIICIQQRRFYNNKITSWAKSLNYNVDQSGEDIQKINDTLDVKGIVGKATCH